MLTIVTLLFFALAKSFTVRFLYTHNIPKLKTIKI